MVTIKISKLLAALSVFCFLATAQAANASSGTPSTSTTQSTVTSEPALKTWEIKLVTGLQEKSFSNEMGEKSLQVALAMEPRVTMNLDSSFKLYIRPQLSFASSQITTRFGDQNYGNRVGLVEAYAGYTPAEIFELRAGAINQEFLGSSLVVSPWRSFPGLQEILKYKFDQNEISFTAQQSVPTSENLASQTLGPEETPLFLTETLALNAKIIKSVELKLFGTLYDYQNLPAKVAFDSSVYGNLTNDVATPTLAKFRYEFMGWMAGGEATIALTQWTKLKGGAVMIENMLAPSGANHGQVVYFGDTSDVSTKLAIGTQVNLFFNESDTVPSYYNSADYGHNNRAGVGFQLDLNFKKPDFKISGEYIIADPINFDPNQTKQQYLGVKLETRYDVL